MSTQVKHRRGTAAENASFTGALGEFTYITDTKRIAAHDAATAGGATFLNVADIQNNVAKYTTAGGTGNAITLAHTFPRTAHTTGAEIQFKATADNSGAVTVAIDSIAGTKALEKMVAGVSTALASGDIKSGVIYTARYDGARYQLQTGGASVTDYQSFTTSGTWSKPSGFPSEALVFVQLWGGGAGGVDGAGSGGSAGGDSSFGGYVTAKGGVGGSASAGGIGGSASTTGLSGSGENGGRGADAGTAAESKQFAGGGGGGKGRSGGTSVFGGAGGNTDVAGSAPGGGGGGGNSGGGGGGGGGGRYESCIIPLAILSSTVSVTVGAGGSTAAQGARGEVRITVFG